MVSTWSHWIGLLASGLFIGKDEYEREQTDQAYNDGLAETARKAEPKLKAAEAKRKRKAERLKREAKNWS